MSEIFNKIKKLHSDAIDATGMSHAEVKKYCREYEDTKKAYYTYIIVGDEVIYALGKGTDDRAKVFSAKETDLGANGHIKGGIGALINIVSKKVIRIFIPTMDGFEALEIEDQLKQLFNFHERSVKEVSIELFDKRLKQLQRELPASIFNEYYVENKTLTDVIFKLIQDPSGNDYQTLKKVIYDIDKKVPNTIKALNKFFEGGFKKLEVPTVNKNQLSLFEIYKTIIKE